MAINKKEWNEFVSNSKWGDILQFVEWANVKKQFGWNIAYITSDDKVVRSIVFIKSIPFWGRLCYIPHGPVFHSKTDLKKSIFSWRDNLVKFARSVDAFAIDIEPKIADSFVLPDDDIHKKNLEYLKYFLDKEILEIFIKAGFYKTGRNMQSKYKLLYSLKLKEDELLKLMHKNTRYNVKYAKRKGIVIKKYFPNDDDFNKKIDQFYDLLKITQKRTGGYPIRPQKFFRFLLQEFATSKNLALFEAKFNNDLIAMNISERTKNWSSSFYAGSNRLHSNLKAMYLLRWESILWAKSYGSAVYDFWGIVPKSKSHKGYSDHKLSFGGARIDHVGILELPLNKVKATSFNKLIPFRAKFASIKRSIKLK